MQASLPVFSFIAAITFGFACLFFSVWIARLHKQLRIHRESAASGRAITDLRRVTDMVFEILWHDPLSRTYVVREFGTLSAPLRLISVTAVVNMKGSANGLVIFTEQHGGAVCGAFLSDARLGREFIESKKKYHAIARASAPYIHPRVKKFEERYDRSYDALFR